MSDLLKDAIADAKVLRETALQNAKIALEEAFTPHLKSMLSSKLKEDEFEDEEEIGDEAEDELSGEEDVPSEEVPAEEAEVDDEIGGEEEIDVDIEVADDEAGEAGEEEFAAEEEPENEIKEIEGVIEVNGVKYAPIVNEEEGDEAEGEEDLGGDEEIDDDAELDLEAIIKELEEEAGEDGEEEIEETEDPGKGEDKPGDAKPMGEGEGIGNPPSAGSEYDPGAKEDKPSDAQPMGEGDEEVFEIDESLFNEEEEEDEGDEDVEEGTKLQAELKEYKEAVVYLKDRLHEVNLLNAKLLFTNKLFRAFPLDNDQKMQVVETFDRAQTVREIKLVYSTLAESFKGGNSIKKKSINESASAKSGSTKSEKKVITEESQVADRFKKLAGLL